MNVSHMTGGTPTPEAGDQLVASIDVVLDAERRVREALRAATDVLEQVRRQRLQGTTVLQIAEQEAKAGREMRRRAAAAIASYEHAFREFRRLVVRSLADEHGLSFTEIGKRLDISRQMVARLYAATEGTEDTDA